MLKSDLPERVRQFIFRNIDSVELLEVLFYLRSRDQNWNSAEIVSKDLRSSINSVLGRIRNLTAIGVVEEHESITNSFRYSRNNLVTEETIEMLNCQYKVQPHQDLEAIFASCRQATYFADAFVFTGAEKKKGDNNG